MKTTIIDGRHTFTVTVVDSERVISVSSGGRGGKRLTHDFLLWWIEQAKAYKAPVPNLTSEDYGIAQRLLKKHGRERLEYLSQWFWRLESEPILDGYSHQLRLFAAKINDVEAHVGG